MATAIVMVTLTATAAWTGTTDSGSRLARLRTP
jgi:hypothetical protein